MKKFFFSLVLVAVATFSITSCTEENVKPQGGGSSDKCQFGGPGCE